MQNANKTTKFSVYKTSLIFSWKMRHFLLTAGQYLCPLFAPGSLIKIRSMTCIQWITSQIIVLLCYLTWSHKIDAVVAAVPTTSPRLIYVTIFLTRLLVASWASWRKNCLQLKNRFQSLGGLPCPQWSQYASGVFLFFKSQVYSGQKSV